MGSADQPPKTRASGRPPDPPTVKSVEDWLAARLAEVSGDDADTEPSPSGVTLDEEDSATVHDEVAVEDRSRARSFATGRLLARRPILEDDTPDPTAVAEDELPPAPPPSPLPPWGRSGPSAWGRAEPEPLPPTAPFPVPDALGSDDDGTTDNQGIELDPEEDTVGPEADAPYAAAADDAWDEVAAPPARPATRGEETNVLLRDTDPGPGPEEHLPTDFGGLLPVPGPEELQDEPHTQWESRPDLDADDDPHTMPQLLDDVTRPVDAPDEEELLPGMPPGRTPAPRERLQAPPTPDDALFEEEMPTVVVGPKTVTMTDAERTASPAPVPPRDPTPAPPPSRPPAAPESPMPVAWMVSASVVMAILLALLAVALVALGLLSPS